jgi:hypothetical protein
MIAFRRTRMAVDRAARLGRDAEREPANCASVLRGARGLLAVSPTVTLEASRG